MVKKLDFGNYPEELKYYNRNKLVVGKMKDETCGVPIKTFAGLKSKVYTYLTKMIINVKKRKALIQMLSLMN